MRTYEYVRPGLFIVEHFWLEADVESASGNEVQFFFTSRGRGRETTQEIGHFS
jgi:hypothetical protein